MSCLETKFLYQPFYSTCKSNCIVVLSAPFLTDLEMSGLMFMLNAKSSIHEEVTTVMTTTFYNVKVEVKSFSHFLLQQKMEVSDQLHAPSCFTSRQRTHSVHWLWGCVHLRTNLNVSGGEINMLLFAGNILESLIRSQVIILTTLSELHCIL